MNKQKINYQKKLDETLAFLGERKNKPSLLLHACCGPCSSYVLEYLVKYFQITVLYYNPNIYPEKEYRRRFNELKKLYKDFTPAINGNVKVVELPYIPEDFYKAIKVREEPELAKEHEKGERCRRCYELRLQAAFDYAIKNNFDYFCTTLSISPFKDAEKINQIGAEIEWAARAKINNSLKADCFENIAAGDEELKLMNIADTPDKNSHIPQWLFSDFKKKGGFKRSLELSDEYNMYRQEYCGCIYSYRSREEYEKSLKEKDNDLK